MHPSLGRASWLNDDSNYFNLRRTLTDGKPYQIMWKRRSLVQVIKLPHMIVSGSKYWRKRMDHLGVNSKFKWYFAPLLLVVELEVFPSLDS